MAQSREDRVRFANDEIVEKGNLAAVEEAFAADYVLHTGGAEFTGTDFVRKFIGLLRSAISDLRVVKIEFMMQAGDRIAWQRTLSGKHTADMMGIPPSGKRVEWRDLLVSRFDGEKISEEWVVSELAAQLLLKLPRA